MKERLIQIINTIKEACEETKLGVLDGTILTEACSTYRGELANQKKSSYTPLKTPNNTTPEPPTDKQVDFLTKMKVNIPKTKEEASKMISNYIANQKNI